MASFVGQSSIGGGINNGSFRVVLDEWKYINKNISTNSTVLWELVEEKKLSDKAILMIPCFMIPLTTPLYTIFTCRNGSNGGQWAVGGNVSCSDFQIDNQTKGLYYDFSSGNYSTSIDAGNNITIYNILQSCNGWFENYNLIGYKYGYNNCGFSVKINTESIKYLIGMIYLPIKNNATISFHSTSSSTENVNFYYGIGHAEEFNINTIWS